MDNFVVSARKYRPADFRSVVGQDHITSTLKNAIARNQLAHAYLFCGPRGVGKTTCARIFAKAINCLDPNDNEACNDCESCRSFNQGRSFNIHELDAASNNSVDDIRSLTEQVRIPPQIGKYSVYIIDEVHMLSSAAFNAFLKTLEEPPAHAVFVLATTEKHKIIPTILSRCQIFDFNRIKVEDAVEYLKHIAASEGVAYDDESLHLIAMKADGGMRDALSMYDKAVSFCGKELNLAEVAKTLNVLDYDTYFRITDLFLVGNYVPVLAVFDEVVRRGFSPSVFVTGLNAHLRDVLMCKDPATAQLLEVKGSLLERYVEQAASTEPQLLFAAISLLTATDAGLRTASNPRLNVELALMKICGAGQKKNDGYVIPAENSEYILPPLVANAGNPAYANGPASGGQISRAEVPPVNPGSVDTSGPVRPVSNIMPAEPGVEAHSSLPADPKASTAKAGTAAGQTELPATAANPVAPVTESLEPEGNAASTGHGDVSSAVQSVSVHKAEGIQPSGEPDGKSGETELAGRVGEQADRPGDTGPERISNSRASIHRIPQTISGTPINSILSSSIGQITEQDADLPEPHEITTDPRAAEKIMTAKPAIVEYVRKERPRFAAVLEELRVDGSIVSLSVPTEVLYEEIMRNKAELLGTIADVARVEGVLGLEVEVKADHTVRRPVKAEDKLAYLAEKNPNIIKLRKELDLELE